jgi:hypothetical protein
VFDRFSGLKLRSGIVLFYGVKPDLRSESSFGQMRHLLLKARDFPFGCRLFLVTCFTLFEANHRWAGWPAESAPASPQNTLPT